MTSAYLCIAGFVVFLINMSVTDSRGFKIAAIVIAGFCLLNAFVFTGEYIDKKIKELKG